MALTGVHITFSDMAEGMPQSPALLPYRATGSQTMTSPGTSSVKAIAHGTSQPLLSISAAVPIYYAVGPVNPDASGAGTYPRRYMDPNFGREDIFVDAGDIFTWVIA